MLFTLGDTVKYVSHIYDLIYEYRIYIPIAFRTQVGENLNEYLPRLRGSPESQEETYTTLTLNLVNFYTILPSFRLV